MAIAIEERLRAVPLFNELDRRSISQIAGVARPKRCQRGELVVRQGEPGESVFIIESGFLKVQMAAPDGAPTTLGIMGPNEIFGELALFDGQPRSATVSAHTRSDLVVIDRSAFLRLTESTPKLAIAVMKVLARRLRRLSERSDELTGMSLATRLAKQLLLLADHNGHTTGGGRIRLGIKLSQQELGELVGATRESVNKHFGFWRREGVIAVEGGFVVISNAPLLRTVADLPENRPNE